MSSMSNSTSIGRDKQCQHLVDLHYARDPLSKDDKKTILPVGGRIQNRCRGCSNGVLHTEHQSQHDGLTTSSKFLNQKVVHSNDCIDKMTCSERINTLSAENARLLHRIRSLEQQVAFFERLEQLRDISSHRLLTYEGRNLSSGSPYAKFEKLDDNYRLPRWEGEEDERYRMGNIDLGERGYGSGLEVVAHSNSGKDVHSSSLQSHGLRMSPLLSTTAEKQSKQNRPRQIVDEGEIQKSFPRRGIDAFVEQYAGGRGGSRSVSTILPVFTDSLTKHRFEPSNELSNPPNKLSPSDALLSRDAGITLFYGTAARAQSFPQDLHPEAVTSLQRENSKDCIASPPLDASLSRRLEVGNEWAPERAMNISEDKHILPANALLPNPPCGFPYPYSADSSDGTRQFSSSLPPPTFSTSTLTSPVPETKPTPPHGFVRSFGTNDNGTVQSEMGVQSNEAANISHDFFPKQPMRPRDLLFPATPPADPLTQRNRLRVTAYSMRANDSWTETNSLSGTQSAGGSHSVPPVVTSSQGYDSIPFAMPPTNATPEAIAKWRERLPVYMRHLTVEDFKPLALRSNQ